LEFATGYSRDCIHDWQQKLTARKLLKRWDRPNARTSYVHTLTEAGESYLETLGYPRVGYADIYSSKKINAYRHLGVSRASLCFLATANDLEWKAEVLPPFTFAYSDDCGLKADKMWKADDDSYAAEFERTKNDDDIILAKMNGYVHAVRNGTFQRLGFSNVRVL
jgi:hypothetical protein